MNNPIIGVMEICRRKDKNKLRIFIERYTERHLNIFEPFEVYNENSKLRRWNESVTIRSIQEFTHPKTFECLTNSFQSYRFCEKLKLHRDLKLDGNLGDIIKNRKSVRNFSGDPLSIDEISKILYYSCGITESYEIIEKNTGKNLVVYRRAIPSGGALYPVEVYLGILNVEEVDHGIYYYNVKEHALEKLKVFDENSKKKFLNSFPGGEAAGVPDSSVVVIMCGCFWRSCSKYGGRGYRYVLQESGHIAQNIYLSVSALNLGCVALGGFYDDELNQWINVDGVDESVIYAVAIGKPKNTENLSKPQNVLL